ncbi:MotA/TolQ/ExbB proton channel family protein [Methanobrevibacter ruminantium M1]|uniref:MotA/TolQ/ExbB proton channel family protein n=1 Tax=Methanobrevibacter ruminantium (strain ATCC 35063 / DSM 1093 / JCM 13430 / OCM 146 / M1) TaxID=634498 RepID=D3E322_METRM|nr:MotA/TolQ/ExbB proton channel family protein [Methanobrevibacter ruminantium]ADC46933.1 MotA/TolQ/ExbB proton channel family protein [Methanobrevibacter ruminantium M1]
MTIPGGDFLTTGLNLISQSLLIPVVIILLVFVVVVVISLGGLIYEYTSRTKVSVDDVSNLILEISDSGSVDSMKSAIANSPIPKLQKDILLKIASTGNMSPNTREAFARKLIENEEGLTDKSLEITDIITRIGPTLGLMGTLIPLGTGLAALGSGDVNTLSESLIVAFDTTVVGIGSGALAYVISKLRNRWYEEYLSNLDVLSDAVLDFMAKH